MPPPRTPKSSEMIEDSSDSDASDAPAPQQVQRAPQPRRQQAADDADLPKGFKPLPAGAKWPSGLSSGSELWMIKIPASLSGDELNGLSFKLGNEPVDVKLGGASFRLCETTEALGSGCTQLAALTFDASGNAKVRQVDRVLTVSRHVEMPEIVAPELPDTRISLPACIQRDDRARWVPFGSGSAAKRPAADDADVGSAKKKQKKKHKAANSNL